MLRYIFALKYVVNYGNFVTFYIYYVKTSGKVYELFDILPLFENTSKMHKSVQLLVKLYNIGSANFCVKL